MKRLIDDPEIAGDLRAELRRYATEQAQVDLPRAYSDLQETLQLKAAVPAVSARSAWSALSGSTKLLLVAAIGGSAALGVNAFRGSEAARQSEPMAQQPQALRQQSQALAQRPQHAQPMPQQTPAARADDGREMAAEPGAAQRGQLAASPSEPPNRAAPASSGSRREIAQLVRIKALLEQDPAAARRLIRAAQREFPNGLLVEEREGLDVIALFALGQLERARSGAERFIARYPQSPLRPKLQRLIAESP